MVTLFLERNLATRIRLFLLLVVYALAFGGFTFYAGFVVPTGGRVLDPTTQGFVTREVVPWLNYFALATAVLFVVEMILTRRSAKRVSAFYFLPVATIVACFGVLVFIYPEMNALLDDEQMAVRNTEKFYGLHRIYLWASTFQWLSLISIGWAISGIAKRETESPTSKQP